MKRRINRFCATCDEELEGRIDKKFCDMHCKSQYQYQQIREDAGTFYHKVNVQLKQNRKILKSYNKAGKATVREEELLKEGFNPRIFTHYWTNKNKKTYLFVYDYGFMKVIDNNKTKYSMVKWQKYMNKQIGSL